MPRSKNNHPKKTSARPVFHEGLEGFDIKVNSFGQMESNFEIEKLNAFLNKEVKDKKLDSSVEKDATKKEKQKPNK